MTRICRIRIKVNDSENVAFRLHGSEIEYESNSFAFHTEYRKPYFFLMASSPSLCLLRCKSQNATAGIPITYNMIIGI